MTTLAKAERLSSRSTSPFPLGTKTPSEHAPCAQRTHFSRSFLFFWFFWFLEKIFGLVESNGGR